MRFTFHAITLTVFAALCLMSCSESNPASSQGEGIPAQFNEIQDRVFSVSCAVSGCHLGGEAPFGLDLSEGLAYDNLVGVASGQMPQLLRVKPLASDESYLINKLRGQGISGDRMPRNRSALSDATIDSIAAWIDRGATR